jgi:hypothetical protein
MKKPLLALSLLLAGCAARDTLDARRAEQLASATPAPAEAVEAVQVEIPSFANAPVCRKEKPTGSRIPLLVCRAPDAPVDEFEREIRRRDIEDMRRQQEYARRTAEAAMRERVTGR